MDNPRRLQGYEYRYRFSTDDIKPIAGDATIPFRPVLSRGFNVFQFQITTNFILENRLGDRDVISSENFCVHLEDGGLDDDHEWVLTARLIDRLREYWMLDDEVNELVRQAMVFARRCKRSSRSSGPRVIPIAAGIEVCTVQRAGEGAEAALERAIRAENLAPLELFHVLLGGESPEIRVDKKVAIYLVWELPRRRVEGEEEGVRLMETCPVCLGGASVGSQVFVLQLCGHAFHYHCIVRWLMESDSCPLCRLLACELSDLTRF